MDETFEIFASVPPGLEPLVNDMVISTIGKMSGLDRRFDLEDVGEMVGQTLIASTNISEALHSLNQLMEFKKDFEPYSREELIDICILNNSN